MKCGFKSNPSPAKLSPTKLHAVNVKLQISPLKYDRDSCKACEKAQEVLHPGTGLYSLAANHMDITEDKPVHNKENLLHRLGKVDTPDVECSELQDSGYSSILNSDSPSQDEDGVLADIRLCETPSTFSLQSQKHVHSSIKLPILHFEEVVCSTLKKSSTRSPKVDWAIIDEVVSRGNFGLENLIGRSMGLERFDILGELFQRDFKHLVTKILRHLCAIDLINVISVSTTWRKLLQRDTWAYDAYKLGCKERCEKEAKSTVHTATRDSSFSRLPLASVQKVASAFCVSRKKQNKNKTGSTSHSRHSEFIEVAKTLRNDQSLKVCRDCGSPAKYDSYLNRAICTRESCKLDFCTLCLCKYHFSKPCTTSKSQGHRYTSEPLPGSKKSKQNLRRL
ncbi:F-box only protein 5 [Rhinophrynus dorsalis]